MATRKRLSDLLREEVQRPEEAAEKPEALEQGDSEKDDSKDAKSSADAAADAKAANGKASGKATTGRSPAKGITPKATNAQSSSKASATESSASNAANSSSAKRGTTSKASSTKTAKTTANQPSNATAEATSSSTASSSSASSSATSDADKEIAALKQTIADLQSTLEESQSQEGILLRQVADLEEAIAQQDKQITDLKTELRSTSTLKQELADAKHLILQMSQKQPEAPKAEAPPAPLAKPEPPAAPPAARSLPKPLYSPPEAEPEFAGHSPMPTGRMEPRKVSDLVPASQSSGALRRRVSVDANAELWRVLEHPVAVELPATQFSDDDIGWVD